ncbi:MAG: ATP-binding protein [Alphaproteobacteria bacterium]
MNKFTIEKKFLSIVIVSMLIISTLCVASIYRIYKLNQNLVLLKMETEAVKLEKTLAYMFDYSRSILTHINNQIYQNGADINYISKLVKSYKKKDKEAKLLFAEALFSWVDKDFNMTASSNIGKLPKPIPIWDKDFLINTNKNPDNLHFGRPIGGYTSGQWVIPTAIGLVGKNNQYLGSMGVGIDIGLLKERLEENLTEPGMSFVIMDMRNYEIITESSNINNKVQSYDSTRHLENIDFKVKSSGLIKDNNVFNFSIPKIYYLTSSHPYVVIINYNKNVINKQIATAVLPQIAIFAAIFATLLLLLYIMHTSIISPLIKLTNFANEIASGSLATNNFKHTNFSYEFNILAQHLMSISYYINHEKLLNKELLTAKKEVEEAHKELLLINEHLEEKVLERTHELEKAVAVKSNFLSNMSHEVRTPIHGVINFAKFLIKQWSSLSDEKKFDIASKIYKNSGRLLSLINNLLDLSKLDTKNMIFSMLEHDLVKLAEDTIEEVSSLLEGQAQASELRFFNLAETTICICDNERLTQVMRNMLANAIKFGNGKPINIELHNVEMMVDDELIDAIKFSVTDQGIGIPPGEENEIFEKFIESSRTRSKAGGTGLGLSICKEIITYHNGQIWGTNNPEGGSTFNFVIPLSQKI